MALITHIGFAASKRFPARLLERWRKIWVSHVIFILQDEVLGPIVFHANAETGAQVMSLQEYEREHTLVGAVQPKGPLGPALNAVIEDRFWTRGGNKNALASVDVVCEVLRRGQYPGAFLLKQDTTASELLQFLQRPPPISREAVRLFNSRTGEPRTIPPENLPPKSNPPKSTPPKSTPPRVDE